MMMCGYYFFNYLQQLAQFSSRLSVFGPHGHWDLLQWTVLQRRVDLFRVPLEVLGLNVPVLPIKQSIHQ